MNGLPVVQPG